MTNREYLETLSDEDFVKWLFDEGHYIFRGIQNYDPTMRYISRLYNNSEYGLLQWLKQERQERSDSNSK